MSKSLVVFGSSRVEPRCHAWLQAEAVGRLAAEKGYTLVSGGYQGAMEAASLGARGAGGHVLGITTPIFSERAPSSALHEIREEPDYPARLAALLREGDAFVALPGGLGTASEWITAWCLASIGQLGGALYCFEHPWRPVAAALLDLEELTGPSRQLPRWVESAEELARLL